MKEPLKAGNKWDDSQVDSVGFEYNVPAGTFGNCLSISRDANDSVNGGYNDGHQVYAPGVGKIEDSYSYREWRSGSAPHGYGDIQLTSYKLK